MSKALVRAAGQGDLATVKALLALEKDIDDIYETGQTALEWAASFGRTEVVRLLLEAGANVNIASEGGGSNPLMIAALYSNVDCVRLLLAYGASPHFSSSPSTEGKGGMTALHNAAVVGSVEVSELLLDAGAEINSVCGGGWTALMWAIYQYKESGSISKRTGKITNHYAVIELLLSRNADVHWVNEDGSSAFTFAEDDSLTEVMLLLKSAIIKTDSALDDKCDSAPQKSYHIPPCSP